jgi:hypothetical protein
VKTSNLTSYLLFASLLLHGDKYCGYQTYGCLATSMHCILCEYTASSDKIPEEVVDVKPSMDAIQQLP